MKRDYEQIAQQYEKDVLSGRILACKLLKKAVQRNVRDKKRWSKTGPFTYSTSEGARACSFIELLHHTKGALASTTIKLEPWQVWIVSTIFGWRRRADNGRRFRRVYIEVPRGNGKSCLSSGVALYCLLCDNELGAEVYSFATTRDQAKIVFNDAKRMCEVNAPLRNTFKIQVLANAITVPGTNSTFQAKSAEGSTLDGLNTHFACIDELHAHKTREVYDVVETSMGKRLNSLLWIITTAGFDPSSICYEVRDYAVKMLNDPNSEAYSLFAAIYTLDAGDDWRTEEAARKANPNYGVSVRPEHIRDMVQKAIVQPSSANNIKTKHFNIWCSAGSAWMDMDAWDACADPALSIEDFRGESPCITLDLSSKNDLTAKVKLFVRKDGEGKKHYYSFENYFLPQAAVDSGRNASYQGWAAEGLITTTPGAMIDHDQIIETIAKDNAVTPIGSLGFDPWNAAYVAQKVSAMGVDAIEYRNTVQNMSEPMKTLEALVHDGRFHHAGNPCTRWQMSNVVASLDRKDNIFPRKDRYENKIDGAVALIMAIGLSFSEETDATQFVPYENAEPVAAIEW